MPRKRRIYVRDSEGRFAETPGGSSSKVRLKSPSVLRREKEAKTGKKSTGAAGKLSLARSVAGQVARNHDLSGHNRSEANKAAYRDAAKLARELKAEYGADAPTADKIYSTAKKIQLSNPKNKRGTEGKRQDKSYGTGLDPRKAPPLSEGMKAQIERNKAKNAPAKKAPAKKATSSSDDKAKLEFAKKIVDTHSNTGRAPKITINGNTAEIDTTGTTLAGSSARQMQIRRDLKNRYGMDVNFKRQEEAPARKTAAAKKIEKQTGKPIGQVVKEAEKRDHMRNMESLAKLQERMPKMSMLELARLRESNTSENVRNAIDRELTRRGTANNPKGQDTVLTPTKTSTPDADDRSGWTNLLGRETQRSIRNMTPRVRANYRKDLEARIAQNKTRQRPSESVEKDARLQMSFIDKIDAADLRVKAPAKRAGAAKKEAPKSDIGAVTQKDKDDMRGIAREIGRLEEFERDMRGEGEYDRTPDQMSERDRLFSALGGLEHHVEEELQYSYEDDEYELDAARDRDPRLKRLNEIRNRLLGKARGR